MIEGCARPFTVSIQLPECQSPTTPMKVAAAVGTTMSDTDAAQDLVHCELHQGTVQDPGKVRRRYVRGLLCAVYVGVANGSFLVRSTPSRDPCTRSTSFNWIRCLQIATQLI